MRVARACWQSGRFESVVDTSCATHFRVTDYHAETVWRRCNIVFGIIYWIDGKSEMLVMICYFLHNRQKNKEAAQNLEAARGGIYDQKYIFFFMFHGNSIIL